MEVQNIENSETKESSISKDEEKVSDDIKENVADVIENVPPTPTVEVSSADATVVATVKKSPAKRRKRKKKAPRDADAPKQPLSGYVRFINERREDIRSQFPDAGIVEITRKLASEWSSLTEEQKRPYLDAAEIDRNRYNKEMGEYKMNEAKKIANAETMVDNAVTPPSNIMITVPEKERRKSCDKVFLNGGNGGITKPANGNSEPRIGDYDIPIFTDEFLDHNKSIDAELRTLRKSNTDYEQQNSVLEKHVENMKNGIDKLEEETIALKENNKILQNYLDKLRAKLANSLSGLSIPGEPNGANLDNIEKYMSDLHNMVTSNSHGPACVNKAKDIIRKLDLQIQV